MNSPQTMDFPEAMTMETIRLLEQASAEMLAGLRRRMQPSHALDAGAVEYDSWAGSLEYDSWARTFSTLSPARGRHG